jgi:hypothetical protein
MAKRYLEEREERGYEDDDRAVCLDHFLGDDLRRAVKDHLTEPACDFCSRTSTTGEPIGVPMEIVAGVVMGAIRRIYERALDVLYFEDDFTARYDTSEAVDELIAYELDERPLDVLKEILVEETWCEEPSGLTRDIVLMTSWESLRRQVMHHQRFVFLTGLSENVVGGLHEQYMSAAALLESLGRSVDETGILRTLPAGTIFLRGRPMPSGTAPGSVDASSLGSPPLAKAAANRMSPAGISMFYGSEDEATVLAEISAHHDGSPSDAVIGSFRAKRELTIVDLTAIPPERIFDEQLDFRVVRFLNHFARDLSRPVALDGSEHVEYVPTQVATEYLRYALGVDGIRFASSLTDGANVVLFVATTACCDEGAADAGSVLELVSGSVTAQPLPLKS